MRCPFCRERDARVVDSREIRDGAVIRRRRECVACGRRFTTYEKLETRELMVVKRDGRREPFDPLKLKDKLRIALTKRPVPMAEVERIVRDVENELMDQGISEAPSTQIGELVLAKLKDLDEVAYIRFASVYREFRDLEDWRREVAALGAPQPPEVEE
ncbi:MAG: transcriptional regulator NrdR [Chloroflexi bacterium]|nr:MAG: transcriptional regulator NrdR [Chloroflexota bacterium]